MERTVIEGIDLNDPERFKRLEHHEMFRRLRAEDPGVLAARRVQGRRLLEHHEARRPHRGQPRHRHLLVGGGRHDDHVGPVPGRRRPRQPVRHARLTDARHGPAEAHALPAAREQGLHAAHDRPPRAGVAGPRQHDRRQRDRERARPTSSRTSPPSSRCRRSPRSWACRRRTVASCSTGPTAWSAPATPSTRATTSRVRSSSCSRTPTSSPGSAGAIRATTSSASCSTPRSTASS